MLFIILSIIQPPVPGHAQLVNDHTKYLTWNEYNLLDWEDFKAVKTDKHFGDAGSMIKIQAQPYYIKDDIYYSVQALFNRNKSWAGSVNDRLLAHEQLHFDLAELYARKIRKAVSELRIQHHHDLSTYKRTVSRLLSESNVADKCYDRETLHGALPDQQARWRAMVTAELQQLSKYKDSKYIIEN